MGLSLAWPITEPSRWVTPRIEPLGILCGVCQFYPGPCGGPWGTGGGGGDEKRRTPFSPLQISVVQPLFFRTQINMSVVVLCSHLHKTHHHTHTHKERHSAWNPSEAQHTGWNRIKGRSPSDLKINACSLLILDWLSHMIAYWVDLVIYFRTCMQNLK